MWKAKAGSQETSVRAGKGSDHRNERKNGRCSGFREGMVRMLMDLYGLAEGENREPSTNTDQHSCTEYQNFHQCNASCNQMNKVICMSH